MSETSAWHTYTIEQTAKEFRTHLLRGLSISAAQARLATYGPNELRERSAPSLWQSLLGQFKNFLVILLLAAAAISIAVKEIVDAAAIIVLVMFNAVIGVIQEFRAESALRALRRLSAPNSHVIRDGQSTVIPASELVPGDIVVLEAGNYVPADLRLIESVNLRIDEASLTGESVPEDKHAARVLFGDVPLGDRVNTAYMGTMVVHGRGKGIAVSTGMHTEIGLIAEMLQTYEEEETPLQQGLAQLGRALGIACLVVCGIVFVVGLLQGQPLLEMFMTAVSLAIAAVPEGLPAVVTICLALGMQRMLRRHALIRKLLAVETLGCTTVICSDKTGTLTQNQITVVQLYVGEQTIDVLGLGYEPRGEFRHDGEKIDPQTHANLRFLLCAGLLCNDSVLETYEDKQTPWEDWRIVGDPTEGALAVAAAKAGLGRAEVETDWPRVAEIPFDSERKRMITIHQSRDGEDFVAFVKGAPDVVLPLCDQYLDKEGNANPLTPPKVTQLLKANQDMACQALRVLAVATKPLAELPQEPTPDAVERGLIFIGLMGMMDPPRKEVKEAIRVARGAGVKTVVITGDHRETAVAVASNLDLIGHEAMVLTGTDLDRMNEDNLDEIVEEVEVYARVSPQHKVKVVEALQRRGHVVAVTGDGVNDAPALQRAAIGVAMGITGTDVSKEVADMVLMDDNYASIVSAIEEGRIIYANIRKFVFYLLSCNVGEILVIFLAMLAGRPMPLRPVQLLWLNLITDGAPALALSVERGEPDTMRRPPRPTSESILNVAMRWGIAIQSLAILGATGGAFLLGLNHFGSHLEGAQTMAFATLTVSELLRAFTARSYYHPVWRMGLFSNGWMVAACLASLALLLAVLYVPFLAIVFHCVPLGLSEWGLMLPLIFLPAIVAEITKLILGPRALRA